MKLVLREDMSRGGTLAELLAWLEGLGFDGIELHRSRPRRRQQSPAAGGRSPRFLPGFAALNEAGYDGYLDIECRISGAYDEALAEAAALLRELWDAA